MSRLTGLRQQWRSLFFPAVVVLYLLFLGGYGLLWAARRDAIWQVDLLSHFTAWFFVGAVPLLVVATARPERRSTR